MTLETLSSNELPTCLVYDTISATPLQYHHHHHHHHEPSSRHDTFVFGNAGSLGGNALLPPAALGAGLASSEARPEAAGAAAGQARRKRRRRQRSCKNKEEAESQRMTHIAVERNRRRLMNEHLNVLRSLMPDSYIQRGDQASIVGGAIDFVKELEQLLQSLEVQKRALHGQGGEQQVKSEGTLSGDSSNNYNIGHHHQDHECDHHHHQQLQAPPPPPPFAQFFAYPQYVWCHAPQHDYSQLPGPPENRSAVADIEVTLTETHASVRVLTPRRPRQLLSMVAGLQSLRLSVLHLNVTTLDSMVLYSLSIKVEEGCNLTTVDDIAAAVHHMLTLIEADMAGLTQ